MKKEWYTAKELTGLGGLPKSPQGLHAKARRESWQKQDVINNKQGNGVEYHYSCLPEKTLIALELYEPLAHYKLNKEEPLVIWVKAFQQLNDGEQKALTELILRDGIRIFLEKVSEV